MTNKLTHEHLQRRAIVYVRQSSVIQVLQNRESQLRQYNLAGYARQLGFVEVETIDEDLGRSASGLVDRPVPVFSGWSPRYAKGRLVRSFAWRPPAWLATAETGTI